jgi:hypothetical protein
MAITIPESEPLHFYSGETVKWKRTDLADYPAPTWTLYYVLQKTGTRITFNSSQDGSTTSHLISLTPATTAGYTVGLYHWVVEARDGTDVYVVDEGYLEILDFDYKVTDGVGDEDDGIYPLDTIEFEFTVNNKNVHDKELQSDKSFDIAYNVYYQMADFIFYLRRAIKQS